MCVQKTTFVELIDKTSEKCHRYPHRSPPFTNQAKTYISVELFASCASHQTLSPFNQPPNSCTSRRQITGTIHSGSECVAKSTHLFAAISPKQRTLPNRCHNIVMNRLLLALNHCDVLGRQWGPGFRQNPSKTIVMHLLFHTHQLYATEMEIPASPQFDDKTAIKTRTVAPTISNATLQFSSITVGKMVTSHTPFTCKVP